MPKNDHLKIPIGFQEKKSDPPCDAEACRTGMTAITAIAGTAVAIGGLSLCAATMLQNRSNAASVVLNDEGGSKLWIIGGEDDKGFFNSTEFIESKSDIALKGPDLNFSFTEGCAVKVNESAIFIIGGKIF